MSEFRIHHDVNELLSLLHVRGGDGAEGYIDLLQKHRTPYVTTTVSAHSAKVKLAEFSKTPEDFLRKYEELKSKNVRNLDPLVYLLSKLCEDKETLQFLQQNAKERSESSVNPTSSITASYTLAPTCTKMSMQELDELRKKLGNVTASSNAPLEQALVEDLLFVLIGVDGRDITAQPVLGRQNRSFIVDSTLDMSIKELVNRILPVASYYSTITRWVGKRNIYQCLISQLDADLVFLSPSFIEEKSSFEYGQVNHALTAAMRTLMKEYLILVTQLEHLQRQGLLSLQKLWFYIQPTMRTMEILASIASSVDKGECMGGSTLSLLHDRTFNYTGDSQAQELCLYLTKAASVPYFEILEKWIYRGIIKDPYSEFMVEEHELQKEKIQEDYNDKYWDQRYTIVQHRIPSFLQKMADKILSTGKYLNVVRECGRDVTCPDAKEVLYTLKERAYVEQIEKAFNYASKVLLDFLMEEKELVSRLRLEALLELALRMSTANTDPFKDDLKIDLMAHDVITQLLRVLAIETKLEKSIINTEQTDAALSGLEAFSFDYIVKWPLSLIINRKALTRYQMLFRHMFYCKHVERLLCNVWISNKDSRQYSLHSAKWFSAAFALRQRMLNFVQNIQYYMMFEVMEPTWHMLENNLKTASNIDDVLCHHTSFLDNCLKDCMLTNPELLKIFSKLMSVCVMFTKCMQRFTQSMRLERLSLEQGPMDGLPSQRDHADEAEKKRLTTKFLTEHADGPQSDAGFEATISKFDSNFSMLLLDLLDKLSIYSTNDCEHSMISIIYRQEHLKISGSSGCGSTSNGTELRAQVLDRFPRPAGLFRSRSWKTQPVSDTQRFVELFVVVDNSEYKRYGSQTKARILQVVNHVDKLYRPLNIRVVLVGLEIWSHRDFIDVHLNSETTLDRFLLWRQADLLQRTKHDNAQLVTGRDFYGDTVGLANKFAMCTDNSGGVNQDHHDNPIGLASTVAHEMGHNFGLSHDSADCVCGPSHRSGNCVMAEKLRTASQEFPEFFSSCSVEQLADFLERARPGCLHRPSSAQTIAVGPRCGNAMLDPGEQCDCGTVEECTDACCDASTCRLTEGAQCAHGRCCENCQFKHARSVCRKSASDCDLPEYCTGVSGVCPEDSFVMNGKPCHDQAPGFCYNGQCPSHEQHCWRLFGPGARVGSDLCFDLNKRGKEDTNCGRSRYGYVPCTAANLKCGSIFCEGGGESITGKRASYSVRSIECKIAVDDDGARTMDMVPTGARCGPNKVCINGRCVDVSVYGHEEDCAQKCNNNGVCNHKKECHCNPSWAPPYCDSLYEEASQGQAGRAADVCVVLSILLVFAALAGGLMCCKKDKYMSKRKGQSAAGQLNAVKERPEISPPTLMESTAAQVCAPLMETVIPSRPAPQPPKKPSTSHPELMGPLPPAKPLPPMSKAQ
ncbi:unnamed protein product, partial [Lampetra planeri]